MLRVGAAAALTSAALVAGCGARAHDRGVEERRLDLPAASQVLHWRADNTLLVASRGLLSFHDPEQAAPARDFPAPNPDLEFRDVICVSDSAAVIQFETSRLSDRSGVSRSVYRFPDLSDPDRYEQPDRASVWDFNPLDCAPLPRASGPERTLELAGRVRKPETGFWHLLPSVHGATEVYETDFRLPTREDAGARRYEAVRRSDGGRVGAERVAFELPFHHAEVRSRHDRKNNTWLWHAATQRGFNSAPERWRLLGWLVGPDLSLQRTVSLPAGPWVHPEGILKALSCFSCGCSCYEHLDVRIEGGVVFVMVSGSAVKDRHRGLYLRALSAAEDTPWTPVALGNIERDFAVAPDGCRVAFRRDSSVFVAQTCRTGR